MPTPDFFGILDATKRLTAPDGLEAAHADGFSWARAGLTFGDSTKLTADDWNRIIANLRLLLMATPGFDPDGRDPADPALMRDVITGFATAKIVELLPATVLDQADELAAALAAITAFVNTVVAAVPTNLNADNLVSGSVPVARLANVNASNLSSGTVPDARLDPRLGVASQMITDWNSVAATKNGWHMGTVAANAPDADWWMGQSWIHNSTYGNQTAVKFIYASSSNTHTWRRDRTGGGWGSWYKLQLSQVEQDARYAQLSGATFTGSITAINGVYSKPAGAAGNTHFWMLDETGMAKGLVYWERASNSVRLQAWGGSNGLIHDLAADALFSGANRIHHDGNASRGAPDWVLEDQKASGTSGGTATSGSWETRTLNTEVHDPLGLVTLASNQFTATVNGWVEWTAPSFSCNGHKTRLYNVTDSIVVAEGRSGYVATAALCMILGGGGAMIAAGKTYRIENRVETTKTTSGMGNANSFGGAEVYARVMFWRS